MSAFHPRTPIPTTALAAAGIPAAFHARLEPALEPGETLEIDAPSDKRGEIMAWFGAEMGVPAGDAATPFTGTPRPNALKT